MQNQTVIGLDVGRSAVKVVAMDNGTRHTLVFPSVVTLGFRIADENAAREAALETVGINERRYFTGETARKQGGATMSAGLNDDWIRSDEYKALVLSAMRRLAHLGVQEPELAHIVVGMPSVLFSNQRAELETVTRAILPACGSCKALAQPMGAFSSFLLNPQGIPIKNYVEDESGRKKSWAVIDIGHFTTDFLLMRGGTYIELPNPTCEGMNHAAEHLARQLNGRIVNDHRVKLSLLDCEQALRDKTIRHHGKVDVTREVGEALDFVTSKIITATKTVLGQEAARLDGILLAGGGAPFLVKKLQNEWRHVMPLPESRMAVAEGFCRYGLGMLLANAQTQKVA